MEEISPFSRYVDTNYSPSERELSILKQLVSERQAVADTFAEKIGEMKASLAALEAQHADHLKFIDDHAKLLAPIRRLPDDVLASISLACLDSKEEPQSSAYKLRMSRRHPSVIISHICTEWRVLALHTPRLWSQIHLKIPELYDDGFGLSKAYTAWSKAVSALGHCFKAWTRRSSSCPISFTLESGAIDEDVTLKYRTKAEENYKTLIDAISSSAHRWKELMCWFCIDSVTQAAVKLLDSPYLQFPLLEEVWFQIDDVHRGRELTIACIEKITASQLFAAPRLRYLTIIGQWGNISALKSNHPLHIYDSITDLIFEADIADEGNTYDSAQALTLLKSLPNLVTVDIRLNSNTTHTPVTRNPISLPHLISMTISSRPVAIGFGPSLDMPLLQSLHLTGHSVQSVLNGDDELLLQYGHRLKELSLPYASMTRPNLSLCLKRLSNVVALKLCGGSSEWGNHDDPHVFILSELSLPGTCPQLEDLCLADISNIRENSAERAFVKLLTAKRRSGIDGDPGESGCSSHATWDRLQKVAINFVYEQTVDISGELRSLEVDMTGVEMVIDYGTPLELDAE